MSPSNRDLFELPRWFADSPPNISPPQERRESTRASAPKVRTGCVTCKKRHLKCDEGKPACMNCLKTKGVCGGYYIKPRKKHERQNKPLLEIITPDSAELNFASDLESEYFEEWRQLAQGSLSGHASVKLWVVFMPQLTRHSETLRHAAMSIGAMSLALNSGVSLDNSCSPLVQSSPHYHHAVDHYCKALRLHGRAKENSISYRDMLIVSILFISFEAMRGNRKEVLQHITHGFSLLSGLVSGNDASARINQLAPNPGELMGEITRLFSQLVTQAQTLAPSDHTLVQPAPVTPSLRRSLDAAGLATRAGVPRAHFSAPVELYSYQPEAFTIPFASISDAEEGWALVTGFFSRSRPPPNTLVDSRRSSSPFDHDIAFNILPEAFRNYTESLSYIEKCRTWLHGWYRSFLPLYIQLQQAHSPDHPAYLRLMQLRVEHLAMCLYTESPTHLDVHQITSMTSLCRELNELVELLLIHQKSKERGPASCFSMQLGLLHHVLFVALHCRDALVRGNAIRIMRDYPLRDCLWDSAVFLAAAEKNREVEAGNVSLADTPEAQWRRLSRREFFFDDAGGKIVFRYFARGQALGGWEFVEEYADMDGGYPSDGMGLSWKRRPFTANKMSLHWGPNLEELWTTYWAPPPGTGSVSRSVSRSVERDIRDGCSQTVLL